MAEEGCDEGRASVIDAQHSLIFGLEPRGDCANKEAPSTRCAPSGFRLRAQTPAKRLNFHCGSANYAPLPLKTKALEATADHPTVRFPVILRRKYHSGAIPLISLPVVLYWYTA